MRQPSLRSASRPPPQRVPHIPNLGSGAPRQPCGERGLPFPTVILIGWLSYPSRPNLNHCHIIASSSILARCVLLLYWRVGLALAIGVWGWPLLGWEKTAVIGWSGRRGVKARASSRGGALGVGGGLARPAKPEPHKRHPPHPHRGQGQSVVIGKKCRLPVASLFIDRGGRGLVLTWAGG